MRTWESFINARCRNPCVLVPLNYPTEPPNDFAYLINDQTQRRAGVGHCWRTKSITLNGSIVFVENPPENVSALRRAPGVSQARVLDLRMH